MKPLVILRINVGPAFGGVIPLHIFHTDDHYLRLVALDFCEKYPELNNESIKAVIYAKIRAGV